MTTCTKHDAIKNISAFILFRVAFNSRFYYPVLAILFLDLGLSIEQYSLLNVAWAISIVGLEVPSGVLADIWGRKKLVVSASVLMVIEMLVFSFAPADNLQLLFYLFLFNRFISGAAEAAASGADEALVYDSLQRVGMSDKWQDVLEKLSRVQSVSFFVVMIVGAAVYDPSVYGFIGNTLGFTWNIDADDVVRVPIYLTLLLSFIACYAAIKMKDPACDEEVDSEVSFSAALVESISALKWILLSPMAFFVIIFYITNDSVIRLFVTMISQFYRVLELPEIIYGVLGSSFALVGMISPFLAKKLIGLGSAQKAFTILSLITFIFLFLLTTTTNLWGLLWVFGVSLTMGITGFLCSNYLNEAADPNHRATILSFKGLAGNVAYGGMGIFFAALIKDIEDSAPLASENSIFMSALGYLPWSFLILIVISYIVTTYQKRKAEG